PHGVIGITTDGGLGPAHDENAVGIVIHVKGWVAIGVGFGQQIALGVILPRQDSAAIAPGLNEAVQSIVLMPGFDALAVLLGDQVADFVIGVRQGPNWVLSEHLLIEVVISMGGLVSTLVGDRQEIIFGVVFIDHTVFQCVLLGLQAVQNIVAVLCRAAPFRPTERHGDPVTQDVIAILNHSLLGLALDDELIECVIFIPRDRTISIH